MKVLKNLVVAFTSICVFSNCSVTPDTHNSYESLYRDLAFEMPVLKKPEFPSNVVVLSDFGGKGDGVTLNSDAFAKAFDALEKQGGGRLVVTPGIWLTGPIVFRSNVELHLEKGALIQFSSDFSLYPQISSVFEGLNTRRCQSPISGVSLENIAITGEGAINGAGDAWRPVKRSKVTDSHWKSIIASGGIVINDNMWFPSEKSLSGHTLFSTNIPDKEMTEEDWAAIHDYLRPVLLNFVSCKNVLLEGVLFENSPSWNLHPLMCENIIIDNIFVRNPGYAQNGDGLDLESCTNAIIVNSTFDVGDDAICIKSGKDEDGRRRGRPTENVIVDNCRVFQGHGGFVVGSEMSGGVKNISVSNCQFIGTDVGLRFKSCRGRGGLVENIYIRDIYMANILREALLFDLFYAQKATKNDTVIVADETTPAFRNIDIRRVTAKDAGKAMFFNGLPEMNIQQIHLEDVFMSAARGAELVESDGIEFRNVEIVPRQGAALRLNNVKNLRATQFKYPQTQNNAIDISGPDTRNIQLSQNSELKQIACNY